ncbi:hypothetical protein [Roseibium sediminis]|nr:hypothetical protein [Roseibium sediminis]
MAFDEPDQEEDLSDRKVCLEMNVSPMLSAKAFTGDLALVVRDSLGEESR